jgi:hypothetical protein
MSGPKCVTQTELTEAIRLAIQDRATTTARARTLPWPVRVIRWTTWP